MNTGGSAFPHIGIGTDVDGMTLRDYFAAKALTGLLGAAEMRDTLDGDEIALVSYLMADSMLKARDGKCKLKLEEEE